MIVAALLLLLQSAPAIEPAPETLALGRELAATGTLASLLPLIARKETAEMLAEHKDWREADKAAFRATADVVLKANSARLLDSIGRGYATRLSLTQLKALVAFSRSDAARARRDAEPMVIAQAMQQVGELDFKGDTRKAWCAKNGKGCPDD